MKIWQKIALGFLVVVIINLANLLLLLHLEGKVFQYQEESSKAQKDVQELIYIKAGHIRWKVNVLSALLNEVAPEVEYDPTKCSLGRFMARVHPQSPEEEKLWASLKKYHTQMHLNAQKMAQMIEDEEDFEDVIVPFYNEKINAVSKKVLKKLDELVDLYNQRAQGLEARSNDELLLLKKTSLIANVMTIILAVVFGFWVIRAVTGPIKEVSRGLSRVAQGDFSQTISVSGRDEISQVAEAVNGMILSLRPLIKNIAQGSKTIKEETEKMATFSENAAKGGEKASSRADRMLTEIEGVVQSVEEEAASINEISSAIKEISQNTTQASMITNEAVDKAQNAGEIIGRLSQVSQDVEGIIKLISSIAEQTNLLALNATIEAARAGEAGKGFAVVAGEVKELARQTAAATEEITEKIRAMQSESQAAVSATESILNIIGQINDISSTIAAAVEEQTAVIADIASKVEDQKEGARILKNEAQEAQQAAKEAVAAALVNLENIKKLVHLAEDFEQEARKFRV